MRHEFSLAYDASHMADALVIRPSGSGPVTSILFHDEDEVEALRDLLDGYLRKIKRHRLDRQIATEERKLVSLVENNGKLIMAENEQRRLVNELKAERRELMIEEPGE